MNTVMKVVRTIEVEVPDLGDRIKKAREKAKATNGRSLTQLAAMAGMTTANWYRIEGEKFNSLPFETLKRIESALDTDFGVFIDG